MCNILFNCMFTLHILNTKMVATGLTSEDRENKEKKERKEKAQGEGE